MLLRVLLLITLSHSLFSYDMTWVFNNAVYCITHAEGQSSLRITIQSACLAQLPDDIRAAFMPSHVEPNQYCFSYGHQLEQTEEPPCVSPEKRDYTVYERCTRASTGTPIALNTLQEMVRTKKIIWYTGAGISAGNVPTMRELEESLGMSGEAMNERMISCIIRAVRTPQNIVGVMDDFFYRCLYGEPTGAHEALAYHLKKESWLLVTENLDQLHERTGLTPQRIDDPMLFKAVYTEELLLSVDSIICIGLSHDDRGFLGYYKACNPQGVIVALCLDTPDYLAPEDYILRGDVQQLLPMLLAE